MPNSKIKKLEWKIRLNGAKAVHVLYNLKYKNSGQQLLIDSMASSQAEPAKYLALHMDKSLKWKHHVRWKDIHGHYKVPEMY